MHAIEKILAKNSGKKSVRTGEIVIAKVDFAQVNDLYLQTIYSFREMNGKKVWDKDRAAFVFDHYAPAPTIKSAQIHKEMREFARENDLTYHFDVNAGVCHQVLTEAGLIYPGAIIVATDSHTTTHGALGAMGTGVGATDMATILISGELWFRVPEIIEIRIDGIPHPGIMPKDVILYIMGQMRADGAVYKAIDFTGSYIDNLGVSERMVLCNMAVEMGAKTAYMQPNEKVLQYAEQRAVRPFEVQYTDEDFQYSESYHFDVTNLSVQVAVPHSVDNVFSLSDTEKVKIDQGFIGTCTGGRLDDLKAGADIIRGKKINKDVRLLIIPASAEVMQEAIIKGYIQDFINAGATISTPGCGPCLSAHEGVLAPGEVCVTASNRNFPGRMGSNKSRIYLASPATVAASALTGYLTNPCDLE
ncbi:3-isopropylmalate dehydratase large subunit [Sedimentibacter sp.]|uniref:3-isopropylmalate dehydratase large subunit n=1 Tax=Sedimentibacter sp. TaxID=1960295 RepID=UPI002896DB3E|nr:3-isopropylmalate dehydratase large subunit [Sedimentibacter sp.]